MDTTGQKLFDVLRSGAIIVAGTAAVFLVNILIKDK